MIARYKGNNSDTGFATNYDFNFKANNEYNIETKIMNNVLFVKDKLGNAFCTYCNVEEFFKEWDVNNEKKF